MCYVFTIKSQDEFVKRIMQKMYLAQSYKFKE